MAFKKGQPGGPGRTKGIPNKKKLLKVEDFLIEEDIPIVAMMWECIGQMVDPVYRFRAMELMLRYCEAPPKPGNAPQAVAPNSLLDVTDSIDVLQIASNSDQE